MDGSSFAGRSNLQVAVELPQALAYSKKTNADGGVLPASGESLGRNAASVIDDFQVNLTVLDTKTDNGRRTSRVTVNVGEAFLNHAKYSGLEFGRETLQGRRQVKFDIDTASLREASDKPTNGGQKSDLVEHGRMQQV